MLEENFIRCDVILCNLPITNIFVYGIGRGSAVLDAVRVFANSQHYSNGSLLIAITSVMFVRRLLIDLIVKIYLNLLFTPIPLPLTLAFSSIPLPMTV